MFHSTKSYWRDKLRIYSDVVACQILDDVGYAKTFQLVSTREPDSQMSWINWRISCFRFGLILSCHMRRRVSAWRLIQGAASHWLIVAKTRHCVKLSFSPEKAPCLFVCLFVLLNMRNKLSYDHVRSEELCSDWHVSEEFHRVSSTSHVAFLILFVCLFTF